jgi:ABC-type transport system involved in cytochrome bd biosynthesis fused ATPase/permease subunit
MMLINKLRSPTHLDQRYPGQVIVGEVPLEKIGRKCTPTIYIDVRQYVQLYDHTPFMFTSSLRNNLDPFHHYEDDDIKSALMKVGLWREAAFFPPSIHEDDVKGKLDLLIKDAGATISLGYKQLLNVARAILKKPQVMLCDYVSSSVAPQYRANLNQVLLKEFQGSTMFFASSDSSELPQINQHINLDANQNKLQSKLK